MSLRLSLVGILIAGIIIGLLFLNRQHTLEVFSAPSNSSLTLWQYQCIDTMKFSRDMARSPLTHEEWLSLIETQLRLVAFLGANCVSLGTPYDEEFIPLLALWVAGARKEHLRIWFRGNFSGWEGWFSYPRYKTVGPYYQQLEHFIVAHSDLFEPGDILTPAPEPEHGIINNIWTSSVKRSAFQAFVIGSFQHCQAAMARVKKSVQCGYTSFNLDVAKAIINADVVKKTGGVIGVDHYVKSATQFGYDIALLYEMYQAPVVIGEFGAPIPDIHGALTDQEQATLVNDLLEQLYIHKAQVSAVNYWVLAGGSTALLTERNELKPAARVVKQYFIPGVATLHIANTLGQPLANVIVKTADGAYNSIPDAKGNITLVFPGNKDTTLTVQAPGYEPVSWKMTVQSSTNKQVIVELDPQTLTPFYLIQKFLHLLFD